MLKTYLSGHKVSAEAKRILRQYRYHQPRYFVNVDKMSTLYSLTMFLIDLFGLYLYLYWYFVFLVSNPIRQEHGITNTEHNQFLGLFGWTPEEYEDGEKVQFFHHPQQENKNHL
jgi:hypothetical protein